MDKSPEYWEGYNRYWYGGQGCPYVKDTIDFIDWWEGWVAAAKEDAEDSAEDF